MRSVGNYPYIGLEGLKKKEESEETLSCLVVLLLEIMFTIND